MRKVTTRKNASQINLLIVSSSLMHYVLKKQELDGNEVKSQYIQILKSLVIKEVRKRMNNKPFLIKKTTFYNV